MSADHQCDVSALRLFYNEAMGQPEKVEGLNYRRVPDRLPRSIPEADVELLIGGIKDLRYRTATLTAYGAGLRISEVVALQVGDVRGEEGLLISVAARVATNAWRICRTRYSGH